ncbi:MAG TPA: NADH-quinone oxidoreductase subunit L, partial [Chondromyces sp.]|nr:NADH-quinone oxidoreductase subunit L [Chondromyces sp.]
MTLYDLIWLVPVFPLIGAAFNGLVSNRLGLSKTVTHTVALLGSGAAWLWGWGAVVQWILREDIQQPYVVTAFTWISGGELTIIGGRTVPLDIAASFQLDALSAVMVGFVTFVGFLIHLYSVGYMHSESDRAYARYFSYLNLFMFAMLTLVTGSNLPVLFVGWEGVGLCSYLLIGFYFEKDWCAAAGMKAFIVNRIGDFGFLLAIFFAFAYFGTLEFSGLHQAMAADHNGQFAAAATIIGVLLFVGAMGKSAQLPLYVWLPDAMAGPTPVSALIHAATMVTAGVYMVARCNFFYQMSPTAMLTVAVIGGVTAVFSATIGLAQNDIKKVLAYSTVSQLGYMFLAAGVGAYIAAIFH